MHVQPVSQAMPRTTPAARVSVAAPVVPADTIDLLRDLRRNTEARTDARAQMVAARQRVRDLDRARDDLIARLSAAESSITRISEVKSPIARLPNEIDIDPQSARCHTCRDRMSIGPHSYSNRWAKQAFSEGTDTNGRRVYFCEPCTKELY